MILKKVIKDNQTIYVAVDKAEAEEMEKRGEEAIFVDEDDEEKEEAKEKERSSDDDKSFFEHGSRAAEFAHRFRDRFQHGFGPRMRKAGMNGRFSYSHSDDEDDDPKTAQLMRILPFMDDEDVHEVVEKYLAGDPDFAKLKLPAIMPFLNEKDCDAVFKKALESKELGHYIGAVAPFVSQKALSALVDQYLDGVYPDLDINRLYPFLDPKDIKRVFSYLLKK